MIVSSVTPEGVKRAPDDLIVEEPMTIQLDGNVVSTTMRTPGNDYELAVGFCHTEGLLSGFPVTGVRYCATGGAAETEFNVVTVETAGLAPVPTPRLGTTSSSCGWCGSEQLDDMCTRMAPLPATEPMPLELLGRVPDLVSDKQQLFGATGAVHAAAVFDRSGHIELVREDVGRHNAVDKVVGRALLDGRLPLHDHVLVLSGRASFEMVQKAALAGVTTVVAVSAPSSLAVDAARRLGLTLVAFGGNVYANAARVS